MSEENRVNATEHLVCECECGLKSLILDAAKTGDRFECVACKREWVIGDIVSHFRTADGPQFVEAKSIGFF